MSKKENVTEDFGASLGSHFFGLDSRKPPDDFFDSITDVSECRQYWMRYGHGESLVKQYLDLDLRIHIHFRGLESTFGDYCAVMGHKSIIESLISDDNVLVVGQHSAATNGDSVWSPRHSHPLGSCDSANDVNKPVFVGVVELLEYENRVKRYASSFVRLDRLDNCHIGWGDSVELSPSHGVMVSRAGCADRELESCSILPVGRKGADGLHEHVQCGTGVVRIVPNDETPMCRNTVVDHSPYDVLRRIGVSLFDTRVGLRIDESFAFVF